MDFNKPHYDDSDVESVYKTLQSREVNVDLPPEVSEVVKQWAIADAVTMLEPWLEKLNDVGSTDALRLNIDIEGSLYEDPDKAEMWVGVARRWLAKCKRDEVRDRRLRELRSTVIYLSLKVDRYLLRWISAEDVAEVDDESELQSAIDLYTQEIERRGER